MLHSESIPSFRQADAIDLVHMVRSGESSAFCELFSRHGLQVRRTAFSILKNAEDAEDAVQDAFIRAYKKIHTFDGRSAFSTWLTRIVINCCLMQLRQRRARPSCSFDELVYCEPTLQRTLLDSRPTPEEECSRAELTGKVRKALSRLPDRLQTAARDQLVHDLPASESAERRGLTVPAAKSQRFRARKMLKRSLLRELTPRNVQQKPNWTPAVL
ncbi:MAG TPA: sigma-70 family RNA polymerase sigma factor [Acidobacteriaceae bacterium]